MTIDLKLSRETPVIVQGQDYAACHRWIESMRRYGTNIAGCVSPATDLDEAGDLPFFPHCAAALAATKAEVCVSAAPPRSAADAALEAAEAGVRIVVSLSTGVPVHDVLRVHRRIRNLGITWIGAATSGLARPAAGIMLGGIPDESLRPGDVAVVTASGSLGIETGFQMCEAGLGQSLYVDVGGDSVKGTRMAALPSALKADAATRAVVLLGAAQGNEEHEFAAEIQRNPIGKPILAYIAGRSLPDAGSRGSGSTAAARKSAALAAAGATVYNSLGALVAALKATA
jgi:succinyl-CoA synthetase alpha subunit